MADKNLSQSDGDRLEACKRRADFFGFDIVESTGEHVDHPYRLMTDSSLNLRGLEEVLSEYMPGHGPAVHVEPREDAQQNAHERFELLDALDQGLRHAGAVASILARDTDLEEDACTTADLLCDLIRRAQLDFHALRRPETVKEASEALSASNGEPAGAPEVLEAQLAKRVYACVRYVEQYDFDQAPPDKLQGALDRALDLEIALDEIAAGLGHASDPSDEQPSSAYEDIAYLRGHRDGLRAAAQASEPAAEHIDTPEDAAYRRGHRDGLWEAEQAIKRAANGLHGGQG
jgi:hypothetical protein